MTETPTAPAGTSGTGRNDPASLGDQATAAVDPQRTVTGVGGTPVRLLDLQPPSPVIAEVQRLSARLKGADRLIGGHAGQLHALANLAIGQAFGWRNAERALPWREVLELGAAGLETVCLEVG